MANYTELKTAISAVIKTNNNQEITGQLLQDVLNNIISVIGANATFAGIATPDTAPGTPDQNVFYIAGQSGTYPNFNAIVLDNEIAILSNKSGTWVKTTTGFATNDGIGNVIGLDNVNDRPVYVNAIKFIGFVPNEASKDHIFSIHGFSSRGSSKSATPNITELDLFILDETASQAAGAERRAASLVLPANTDITKPTFSKITGNSGTLYVIIDWNPVVNYQVNGRYSYIVWGANFANPSASNLVRIQKLDANDPRITNWEDCIKSTQLSNTYGTSETKISNEFLTASLFGIRNGLSFNFSSRYANELRAMRIVKKAYFSFKGDTTPTEVGIGVLGNGGGNGTNFWFGFGNLDGTGEGYGTTSLIPVSSIDGGTKSFYYEDDKYKWYVELDFSAWLEIGNVIWSWSTPCCKLNNIIPENDAIWKQLQVEAAVEEKLLITKFGGEAEFISSGVGYININTGAVGGDIWSYVAYRCKEGDIISADIKISTSAIGTNVCAVYAVYSSETQFTANNLLYKGPQWGAEAKEYSNNNIVIPKNAKCIVFCYQRLNSISVKNVLTSENVVNIVSSHREIKSAIHLTSESYITLRIKAAILDARLILDDESMHNAFWNTGHTFTREEVTYTSEKKLFGICQSFINSSGKPYINWYWMMPNGNYIPWNSSFNIIKGEGKILHDDVEYLEKRVNLDGYSATLYIVIDWSILPNISSVFSNNYLDNSVISVPHEGIIQTMLLSKQLQVEAVSPTQFSDMTKLNFGVDGDSITTGNQWSYYVTQILGFASHHNVGVGSATWACRKQTLNDITYQTQEYDAEDFAGISSGYESTTDPVEIQKRCNNCAKVHVQKFIDEVTKGQYPIPDIFAFAMGTNDSDKTAADNAIATGTNYPSGDMLFTLAGAMKWCIQKIHETYPSCKIYVLLPIQRYAGGNENNLEKIEIMKDIAKAFSVEVIDMYSNCGISSMLENGTGPYLRDGLHPNTDGQKLMGKYAASVIRNYIVL